MSTEAYVVQAEAEVSGDVAELQTIDEELVDEAIRRMGALRGDPWLGEELRERYNLRAAKGCRKLAFDVASWSGKPRFRIVHRNEPLDGAPGLVRIWAIGPREKLIAYARATARITREEARRRRGPPRSS